MIKLLIIQKLSREIIERIYPRSTYPLGLASRLQALAFIGIWLFLNELY